MPNQIFTTNVCVPLVSEIESNLPILMNGRREFNKNFVAGNGTSMEVSLPGYGTVGVGEDASATDRSYTSAKVQVVLSQFHEIVELSMIEKHLQMKNFSDQVAEPYGLLFSSAIQTRAANELLLKAATATVVAASATAGSFSDIRKSITPIRAARSSGKLCGVVSPELAESIANSGQLLFNPSKSIDALFLRGELGQFGGAQWYQTPDVSSLTTGTHAIGAGTTLRVKTLVNTAGATAITLEVNGGTATLTGTVLAGEIITLAGVKAVDVFGQAIAKDYAFVVQADATAAANEIELVVKPLYFTGVLKNVSTANIAANTVATFATLANKTYNRGIVWAQDAFITAAASITPPSGAKVQRANGDALQITLATDSDILKYTDIARWDTLVGFKLVRENFASTVLVEQA